MVQQYEEKDQLKETILNTHREENFYESGDRNRYLGELPERVFLWLSKEEVAKKEVYPEVEQILRVEEDVRLILDQSMRKFGDKYLELARTYERKYTLVSNPDLVGKVGLVLVAPEAVENPLRRVSGLGTYLTKNN